MGLKRLTAQHYPFVKIKIKFSSEKIDYFAFDLFFIAAIYMPRIS